MEMIWRPSPYWSQTTYSSTGAENDNISRSLPFNDSGDSIASVVLPNRALRLTRSVHPPVVNGEVYRNVTAHSFFLCFCSVMLLSSGFALVGVSFWALLTRISYLYLSDHASYLGIISFTVSAGLLCFPSSWLAWISDTKKHGSYIPLLSLFLCVSIIMLGTGTCLGITYHQHVPFDWIPDNLTEINFHIYKTSSYLKRHGGHNMHPILRESSYRIALNGNMIAAQHLYDAKESYRLAWDSTQQHLQCCGVNYPMDWFKVRDMIPLSCCNKINHQVVYCTKSMTFQDACLDAIAFDLSWQTSLLTGIGFTVIFLQLVTLMLSSYIYLKTRLVRSMHRTGHTIHNHSSGSTAPVMSLHTQSSAPGYVISDINYGVSNSVPYYRQTPLASNHPPPLYSNTGAHNLYA